MKSRYIKSRGIPSNVLKRRATFLERQRKRTLAFRKGREAKPEVIKNRIEKKTVKKLQPKPVLNVAPKMSSGMIKKSQPKQVLNVTPKRSSGMIKEPLTQKPLVATPVKASSNNKPIEKETGKGTSLFVGVIILLVVILVFLMIKKKG
jgi:hypothetical protein